MPYRTAKRSGRPESHHMHQNYYIYDPNASGFILTAQQDSVFVDAQTLFIKVMGVTSLLLHI